MLNHLDLEVTETESVSVISSSGSGKFMLLHLLGGLDMPSKGKVMLINQDLGGLSQEQSSESRNRYLGFAYQFYHLLPESSALENVTTPLLIGKTPKVMAEEKAIKILKKVGLDKRILHHPSEFSGGERQHVATARALANEPECLLADESTGNLDHKNTQNMLDMMLDLKHELNTSLIVVTHDDELAERFDWIMTMKDGSLQVLQ